MRKPRMKGVDNALKNYEAQVDSWGAEDPELNSNLVGYGVATALVVGVGTIGAPAILALAGYGGFRATIDTRDATYERFLVARMKNDPGFVDELKERVNEEVKS